ncbi:MAG TPA: 6-phosphogluconolactonase [Steroidobacteraceae bacterium]|nr:6-phosphogluconolactonase [Steroidobacteraceae bacterium]
MTRPEPAPQAMVREWRDGDPSLQAAVLAAAIAAQLRAALVRRGAASLVVSGGRTPLLMFAQLARHALDWTRVHITLADERWVGSDDPASNEGLVRATLLRGAAAQARFQGLKNAAATPAAGALQAWEALGVLPRPFDVVVLGMGEDGHTASLFPGDPQLPAGLDADLPPGCLEMHAPAAPQLRLSLNLSALLDARRIVIQIQGAPKWQVYQRARAAGEEAELPIRAIFRHSTVPLDVYWCPDAGGSAP